MSEFNPLHLCTTEKPELYEDVQLFFEDDLQTTGQWTGRFWWSHGHEVVPMCWQHRDMHFHAAPRTLHSVGG